ncbi:MAG TPA: nucleotide exchange factor GrpE [Candidatus Binatus sp.]|jgi:molecular chaperone GrpE|uniref:nucleotide exchange factor GrpE n=1 Tax=Candidatus Binatus sp. TaxID=2811406 RepID=UPI002F3FB8FF
MNKRHKHPQDGNPGMDGEFDPTDAGAEAEQGRDAEALRAQIAEKDKEIAELKDKYLRALADSENARKRIRQQSEESVRIQRESILRDLLPIIDNLERALAAARNGTDTKTIVDGVEMTVRALIDFLRAQGVTPLLSVGQTFDPNRHEAVDHVASEAHPANTVVDEFHRGYLIGERVLRPARVSVAKGNETDSRKRNGGENDASDVENN